MKARCISYTEDRATVILEPSWLGWLFGARPCSADLMRRPGGTEWWTVATGRMVANLDIGTLIINALDFREVGSEPRRVKALLGGVVAP